MRSTVGCRSIVIVSALLALMLSACKSVTGIGPTTVVHLSYWENRASLPTPRSSLAAAVDLGRIYVFGGAEVDAYSPAMNNWAAGVTSLPTPRASPMAVTGQNGLIYTIGGGYDASPTTKVEAYDPSNNTWTCSVGDTQPGCASSTLVPMPTVHENGAAALGRDGRIYVFGGDQLAPNFTMVEVYDPTNNTWACSTGDTSPGCASTSLAPMPSPDDVAAAETGSDGRIYLLGLYPQSVVTSVIEAYDPGSNTWICSTNDLSPSGCSAKTLAPMPTARAVLAGAVAADSRIFAIGGWSNNNALATVEAYDTTTNTWTTIASLNTVRQDAAAVRASDGCVYAMGGFNVGGSLASTERYVDAPSCPATTTPISSPFPQVDPTPHCLVCSSNPTPTHATQPTPRPTPTHAAQPTPTPTPKPSCRVIFSGTISTINVDLPYIDLETGQTSSSQASGDDLQWSTLGPAPVFDAVNGTHLGDLSNYSAASCATLEGLTYPKSTEPATNGETFAAKLADGDLAKVQVSVPGTEPYPMLQVVTYAP